MVELICKNGTLKLSFENQEIGNKLHIKLKTYNTDSEFVFEKIIKIITLESIYDVPDNIGYFEYTLVNNNDEILESKSGGLIRKISMKMDIQTPNKVYRDSLEITSDDYKDNNKIIIDKNEEIYFDSNKLKSKITDVFKEFIKYSIDFIYIQDPYFDYGFYKNLLENIPTNLLVKIKYSKLSSNLPSNNNFVLKKDQKRNTNNIHDRLIISKNFGYQIGISLNGINKNKSFVTKIYDTNQFLKEFNF